jgi:hypothetical protein
MLIASCTSLRSRTLPVLILISGMCIASFKCSAQSETHRTQPSLRDTLDWLTGTSLQESGDGSEYITFESQGCRAVITEHRLMAKPEFVIRTAFDFSDLDPNGFSVVNLGTGKLKALFGDQSNVQFHTRNYAEKMLNSDTRDPNQTPTSSYEFTTNSEFANRFARAMKRAAVLCGAKTSSF